MCIRDRGVAAQMEISSRAPCRNHSLCGSSRGGTAGLAGIWTGTYVAAGDDGTGICSSCIGTVAFTGSRQPVGADSHFAAGLCVQYAVSELSLIHILAAKAVQGTVPKWIT